MVVTSGAERIAEVRARFALEAVPSKQLSIDADLNAGFITTNEAHDKRRATVIEQEFYGTMDGATKFIRGDATVAIISVLVNSLVGLLNWNWAGWSINWPSITNLHNANHW